MSKETAFLVFCLENYKVHKSLTGKQAMELFCKTLCKFLMDVVKRAVAKKNAQGFL